MSHRKPRHGKGPRSKGKRRVEILDEEGRSLNSENRKISQTNAVRRAGVGGRPMSPERSYLNTTAESDSFFDSRGPSCPSVLTSEDVICNFGRQVKTADNETSGNESSHPIQKSFHDASYGIKPKSNRCPGCQGHIRGCSRRNLEETTSEDETQQNSQMWSSQIMSNLEYYDKSPSDIERAIGRPRRASSPLVDNGESYGLKNDTQRKKRMQDKPVDFVIELSTDVLRGQRCFVLRNDNEAANTHPNRVSRQSRSKLTTSARSSKPSNVTISRAPHNCEQKTCPNYIGALTKNQAESKVTQNSTFRVYHRTSDVPTEPSIKLFVVYKTSRGTYQHYPINRVETVDGKAMFQVDMEDEHNKNVQPIFPTIELLIKYYSTYVHMRRCRITGQLMVDSFGQPAAPKVKE